MLFNCLNTFITDDLLLFVNQVVRNSVDPSEPIAFRPFLEVDEIKIIPEEPNLDVDGSKPSKYRINVALFACFKYEGEYEKHIV